MSIGVKGENLIFLISQPASGSTMLQRVLGNHSQIHTLNEPWLMLHPLYALRGRGHEAEYDARAAWLRLQEVLRNIPDGEEEYFEGVRRMYAYLYDGALAPTGKRYFLDKTPPYYLIVPELARTFPAARIIFLLRNPLAVLCSILTNFVRRNWFVFYHFRHDLFSAPALLVQGLQLLGERALVAHYEQIVSEPEAELARICKRLDLPFEPEMVEYARPDQAKWMLTNPKLYEYTRPMAQNAEQWIQALRDPQVWRLCDDYLNFLGKDTLEQMGYSYPSLRCVLEEHRPNRLRQSFTLPMSLLLRMPAGVSRRLETRYEKYVRPTAAGARRGLTHLRQ